MINVFLSINVNQVEQFFDNWRFDIDGNRLATDFSPYQTNTNSPSIDVYDPFDFVISELAQYLWKDDVVGINQFQLVNILVSDKTEPDWSDPNDPDPKIILTVVNYVRETFPGAIQVLDAFKRDGIRHGQTLAEDGVTIVGQPTYPPIPKLQFLDYLPDDLDEDGNVIGPATDYKQVNLVLGWNDRVFE